MNTLKPLFITSLILFTKPNLANSTSPLELTSTPNCLGAAASILSVCTFSNLEVGAPLTFYDKLISTKFVLNYDFACQGHPIRLGFGSTSGRSPLVMGSSNNMVSVISSSTVNIIDENPDTTLAGFFAEGCSVATRSLSKYPSDDAIKSFRDTSISLTKIIQADMELLILAEALAEINHLTVNQYERLRDMTWDYLDFAIEEAGFNGIEDFSDTEFKILSIADMEIRGILSDWEDLTDDEPTISDFISVLNFVLQNLDTTTPVPSPLDSNTVTSTFESLSGQYSKQLRRSTRNGKRFLREVNKFVEDMDQENQEIVASLRKKISEGEPEIVQLKNLSAGGKFISNAITVGVGATLFGLPPLKFKIDRRSLASQQCSSNPNRYDGDYEEGVLYQLSLPNSGTNERICLMAFDGIGRHSEPKSALIEVLQ